MSDTTNPLELICLKTEHLRTRIEALRTQTTPNLSHKEESITKASVAIESKLTQDLLIKLDHNLFDLKKYLQKEDIHPGVGSDIDNLIDVANHAHLEPDNIAHLTDINDKLVSTLATLKEKYSRLKVKDDVFVAPQTGKLQLVAKFNELVLVYKNLLQLRSQKTCSLLEKPKESSLRREAENFINNFRNKDFSLPKPEYLDRLINGINGQIDLHRQHFGSNSAKSGHQIPATTVVTGRKHKHYHKDTRNLNSIDVYRVLNLFAVTDPCIQHAIKKLLVAGGRGAGKDVQESIDSLLRWQEMLAEDNLIKKEGEE